MAFNRTHTMALMPRPLGQHFLADGRVLRRITEALALSGREMVIEIGAGRGALTSLLAASAGLVAAVELDPLLAAHLRATFPAEPTEQESGHAKAGAGRVEVIETDILRLPLASLPARYGFERARVAGNLPYYITSPILTHLFAARHVLDSIVVMVQLEVAHRITARPGRRDYGLLSVSAQYFTRPELLFRIPPGAFRPAPKVDSALIRLTPCDRGSELGIADADAFLRFVGGCFRQKRKTLANNLKDRYAPGQILQGLSAIKAKPNARAEELAVEQLAALYRAL